MASGYGELNVDGRPVYAHRLVLDLVGRPLRAGEWSLHRCDTPSCVNPAHLFAGTHLDNMRDMEAKGRRGYTGSPGERHPMAKLTEEIVRDIRGALARGASGAELGRQHGVTKSTISAIKHRRSWAHV
jgi:hypothetical protein